MFNIFFENYVVYEIMWKEFGTAHALWVLDNKHYTHTLRTCNTYSFSTATMVMRMRLNVTL